MRSAGSRALSPGPRVQDGEAVVAGALCFNRQCDGAWETVTDGGTGLCKFAENHSRLEWEGEEFSSQDAGGHGGL